MHLSLLLIKYFFYSQWRQINPFDRGRHSRYGGETKSSRGTAPVLTQHTRVSNAGSHVRPTGPEGARRRQSHRAGDDVADSFVAVREPRAREPGQDVTAGARRARVPADIGCNSRKLADIVGGRARALVQNRQPAGRRHGVRDIVAGGRSAAGTGRERHRDGAGGRGRGQDALHLRVHARRRVHDLLRPLRRVAARGLHGRGPRQHPRRLHVRAVPAAARGPAPRARAAAAQARRAQRAGRRQRLGRRGAPGPPPPPPAHHHHLLRHQRLVRHHLQLLAARAAAAAPARPAAPQARPQATQESRGHEERKQTKTHGEKSQTEEGHVVE